ncbi:MAG TPA: class I SAM-dependent methyltransferase [Polyangiaceae bacterium]|nr:class I SAM-dependent methyltransferase [Polyangiaceae bacterium]
MTCPVCASGLLSFLPFGVGGRVRLNAVCPACLSLERDRAAWLALSSRSWLDSKPRLLHVAPEYCLEPRLRRALDSRYVTGDLLRTDVDRQLSVEELPFEDGRFDAIICNHVLEHVRDDRKALSELRRVLAPGGWALLQVPLDQTQRVTVEDPSVTSPRERRRRFGQHDHVRAYGRDYVDRLRAAGFDPELCKIQDSYAEPEIQRHGLDRSEVLHFCRRA